MSQMKLAFEAGGEGEALRSKAPNDAVGVDRLRRLQRRLVSSCDRVRNSRKRSPVRSERSGRARMTPRLPELERAMRHSVVQPHGQLTTAQSLCAFSSSAIIHADKTEPGSDWGGLTVPVTVSYPRLSACIRG